MLAELIESWRINAAEALSLIVDDESSVRDYVTAIVEREQFRTIEAENAIRAAHIIENFGDAIDLIVSDIQIPGGDGMTLACSVRESFPTVPFVLMSGFAEPGRETHPSISFEFVQKTFSPETLLTAIGKAMKMMELRKQAAGTD